MTDIYFDERFIGTKDNPEEFSQKIKEMRRNGKIPNEINVEYSQKEDRVNVVLSKGRARRPLIIVEEGEPKLEKEHIEKLKTDEMNWADLVDEGVVEYLDAGEEENTKIALNKDELTPEHTHLEISPLVIMGPQAAMVPYPEHSLSYRVTIGAKMSKQSIGNYALNYPVRQDTDSNLLTYPQKPIVKTMIYDALDFASHPAGQNLVVAVMPFNAYNMEDAIVFNKASIERGLFRSYFFRPYSCEERKYPGGLLDSVEIPDKEIKGYKSEEAYQFLEEDGIIFPEAELDSGDVIVGKTSPPRFLTSLDEFNMGVEARRETSKTIKHGEKGVVDSVMLSETDEGNEYVKVNIRDRKIPEIGDKFASRHGQKGVIGLIVPEEDMPFTPEGVVPDIIFSPHGIPSRMTVGHVIELIGGKVGALNGEYIDSTAWQGDGEFELRQTLKELGFREDGSETMYDGKTGENYDAKIFIGSQYYYKLKHIVSNKLHARSRGPIQLLTRQPTEGRSREGGLRLGEMEKDCFIGHGSSLLLKERFESDKAIIPICEECGMVGYYDKYKDKMVCPKDGEDASVSYVEMSYAFKLLMDELRTMCIYPKFMLRRKGSQND